MEIGDKIEILHEMFLASEQPATGTKHIHLERGFTSEVTGIWKNIVEDREHVLFLDKDGKERGIPRKGEGELFKIIPKLEAKMNEVLDGGRK